MELIIIKQLINVNRLLLMVINQLQINYFFLKYQNIISIFITIVSK